MPRSQVETAIGGVKYRLRHLGGDTIATLGDEIAEAGALTMHGSRGVAGTLRRVREELVAESHVLVIDKEGDGKARWVSMKTVFGDHFSGPRAKDLGIWFHWALGESGLRDFLAGAIGPVLQLRKAGLASGSPPAADGSPIDSSSTSE